MTSVSAGHIILTPAQSVGSGRPQRRLNSGIPHKESRALPTELPPPLPPLKRGGLTRCRTVEQKSLCIVIRILTHSALLTGNIACTGQGQWRQTPTCPALVCPGLVIILCKLDPYIAPLCLPKSRITTTLL